MNTIKECFGCGNDIESRLVSRCTKCGAYYCEICSPVEQVCNHCAPKTVENIPRDKCKCKPCPMY